MWKNKNILILIKVQSNKWFVWNIQRRNQNEGNNYINFGDSLDVVVVQNNCKIQGSPDPWLGWDCDEHAQCCKIPLVASIHDYPSLKGRLKSLRALPAMAVL